jgi:hypothetical protein
MSEIKRKRESWPIVVARQSGVHRQGEDRRFGTVAEAVAWAQENLEAGEYQLIRVCPKKLVVSESTKKVARFDEAGS